jgi:hypothetical protein
MRMCIKLLSLASVIALLGACNTGEISGPTADVAPVVKAPSAVVSTSCTPRGNEGYDFTAMMYRGRLDGVDFNWDCTYYGDPTLANVQFILQWNAEYVRAVSEGGSNPPYNNAYYSNQWLGKSADGNDQITFIKLVWTPWCASIHIPDERVCVGQFEVKIYHFLAGHEFFMIVSPGSSP